MCEKRISALVQRGEVLSVCELDQKSLEAEISKIWPMDPKNTKIGNFHKLNKVIQRLAKISLKSCQWYPNAIVELYR